jgi:hypothetical protein
MDWQKSTRKINGRLAGSSGVMERVRTQRVKTEGYLTACVLTMSSGCAEAGMTIALPSIPLVD